MIREPEPLKPHEQNEPLSADRFFCFTCGDSYLSENGCAVHCKNAHLAGEDAEKGVDFAQGWQVDVLLGRWRAWERAQLARAALYFELIQTPDDFLLECENDRP